MQEVPQNNLKISKIDAKTVRKHLRPAGKISINQKDDIEQNLRYYYQSGGEVKLSDVQERIRQRLVSMQGQLLNNEALPDILKAHEAFFGVTAQTARNDYNLYIKLAGDIQQSNKTFERLFVSEQAKEGMRQAKIAKDMKAHAMYLRVYMEVNNLDKEDKENPYEKITPSAIFEVIEESNRLILDKIAEMGTISGTINLIELTEGIDFENIKIQTQDFLHNQANEVEEEGEGHE